MHHEAIGPSDLLLRQRHFRENIPVAIPRGTHPLESRAIFQALLGKHLVEILAIKANRTAWGPLLQRPLMPGSLICKRPAGMQGPALARVGVLRNGAIRARIDLKRPSTRLLSLTDSQSATARRPLPA